MTSHHLPEHLQQMADAYVVESHEQYNGPATHKLVAILAAAQAVVDKGPYQFSTRNPRDTYLLQLKEALADD